MKKALITGIKGQDGSWLSKLLLDKNYEVIGGDIITQNIDFDNLDYLKIKNSVNLINLDLTSYKSVFDAIKKHSPDEVYNLAAQSSVGYSFKDPITTTNVNSLGTLYLLEALRNLKPDAKFFQASTSEIFGNCKDKFQTEKTKFNPINPYGISKLYSHLMTVNFRQSFGMHTSCGILYNHESELRDKNFVTRKITSHVANYKLGNKSVLQIGNVDAKRDWGYAKDYVEAMYLMLQQSRGEDYILATGVSTSVKDFINYAFAVINISLTWKGKGIDQKAFNSSTNELLVEVNKEFFRPIDTQLSLGNIDKAKKELNWQPKTNIKSLVKRMVNFDLGK